MIALEKEGAIKIIKDDLAFFFLSSDLLEGFPGGMARAALALACFLFERIHYFSQEPIAYLHRCAKTSLPEMTRTEPENQNHYCRQTSA